MICPNCEVQMHQEEKKGGGVSEQDKYITWEVKVCPLCERKVVEHYTAVPVSTKDPYEFGKKLQEVVEEIISTLYPIQ